MLITYIQPLQSEHASYIQRTLPEHYKLVRCDDATNSICIVSIFIQSILSGGNQEGLIM